MILVCEADDFKKMSFLSQNKFCLKFINICHKQKFKCLVVFQAGQTGL